MEAQTIPTKLSGFAQYLVTNQVLTEEAARLAVDNANANNEHLSLFLTKNHAVPAAQLAQTTAHYFDLPYFDLCSYDKKAAPQAALQSTIIQQHYALPLFIRDSYLYVGVIDPTLANLNEISFLTGLKTAFVIVNADDLNATIDSLSETVLDSALDDISDSDLGDIELFEDELDANDIGGNSANDAPVVRYINKLLQDAINCGASDIHFEPFEQFYRVRFRLDGILSAVAEPPIKLSKYLTARLKIMANLDISERRVPQDGRFKLRLSKKRSVDFRVSSCPTLHGEKIVLRILESSAELLNMDLLGYNADDQAIINAKIQSPQGMILVTGPTGSGKTVSLYTALHILNTPEKNISTAEDPIEIQLPGINQVQINTKTGLTFASALRAFLRQDPDIIMVGEIRDLETAEIAVKASQTGHLVLSTLHTNSAAETLVRIANMGVPAYNIASSISLIIAQRLARRLCEHCKKEMSYPADILAQAGFDAEEIDQLTLYTAGDCEKCHFGYKGRVGIYEVMPISEAIAKMILESKGAVEIATQASSEGVKNLKTQGLNKVRAGVTSLEEINRVILT